MKAKIWILIAVFVILAAAAVAAAAIFYTASNIDRYRPLLERHLSAALGHPVRINGISMAWSGGLAAQAQDLVVSKDGKGVIKVRSAAMKLDPWALLSKRLVIRSVQIIEPQATLIRKSDGTLAVSGVDPSASGGSSAAAPGAFAAGEKGSWSLLIQNVQIKDGVLTFIEESSAPPRTVIVRNLDAEARNVSFDGPITVQAQAAIFGEEQNMSFSGRASALRSGRPKLEALEYKANLDLIDTAQLARMVPETVLWIDGQMNGRLAIQAPELTLGGSKVPDFTVRGELAEGAVRVRGFRPRIDRLDAKVQATRQTAEIESATVGLAGGEIKLKGRLNGYDAPETGSGRLSLTAKGLKIENFLERDASAKTLLEGDMGGAFEGAVTGLDAESAARTLEGKILFDFPNGIVLNLNIVREVLGKLGAMFPDLVQKVEAGLPEKYREQLTSRSTILKPLRHEFEVREGSVLVRDLSVKTDFFSAALNGDLNLDGRFEGRGVIQLDNTFSTAFFEGSPELQTLANAASQIELPLVVRYRNKKLSVLPDLEEIGRRLIRQSGQKLLSQLLSGVSAAAASKPADASAAPPASAAAADSVPVSSAAGEPTVP